MKKTLLFLPVLFLLAGSAWAQLTGTRTIPGDYATIAAAVTDLNTLGVGTGGVTFNVAAGHTETITAVISLTATGTAANPIVFQRSGTGANPLITAYTGGTATPSLAGVPHDGIWRFIGSDWVTINGIDLQENAANTAGALMEYGFAFYKASATDGCNNNTIRNCVIALSRANNASGSGPSLDGSKAINLTNSLFGTPTEAVTITSVAGASSNNTFISNIIQNCNLGIVLVGFADATPFSFADTHNRIGGGSGEGNTIINFGGGGTTSPAAGIRTQNQYSLTVSNNTINNNDGAGINHATTLRGIFFQAATSASLTCTHNHITIRGGGTTTAVTFIENAAGSTPAGNTVTINNNTLTGNYLTATSGVFYGIRNEGATPAVLNIQNNTITDLSYSATALTGSGVVYPISTTGSHTAMTINATGNTVNNITRTGTTGGTTIGIFISGGTGGMTINVNNNTVTNMSIGGAGTASTMYGIQTPTGTVTMNNNMVNNVAVVKTTGTSELNGIRNVASPVNETYNNNIVHTLTHTGTGIVHGFSVNTTTGVRTMSGNLVHTLSGAGTEITGIHSASSSPNIFKNKIYNIVSTSTGAPVVSGIVQAALGTAGTANIFNNFIGDLRAPNANPTATAAPGAPSVRGIHITTTTGTSFVNLFYNTVYLEATSTGANFGTAALFAVASTTATTATLTLRNNIFVNNSTRQGAGLTVAYQRSAVALDNYHSSSNNNLFHAGTPGAGNLIFFDGTNSDQTIAGFQTRVTPRESHSFSENPAFVSTTGASIDYLKINPAIPTQIESGGVRITSPLAITDDYFGTIRALETGYTGTGTAPDIGAFEGQLTLLDLIPPIISYTPLAHTASTTHRTLVATITDPSGVPTTAPGFPHLYWRIGTGSWQVATPVAISGNNFTFNFGAGVVLGDVVSYYIVAQDMAVPPNVGAFPSGGAGGFSANPPFATTPPATPSSYTIVLSIGGTLTVGTGGDYPSLTGVGGLFADINSKAVTANITALIVSNLTESGANALNQWVEDSPGNFTVTIRPNTATTPTVSGAFEGGLIRLNGADRVTIDGSNAGGTDRSLTIQNNSAVTNTAAIQIISLGTGLGATNNTIRNCNIKAGEIGTTTALNTFGIFVGGTAISPTGTGADNDNLTIQNNAISKARYGIYARGLTLIEANDGLIIIANAIGSDVPAEFVTFRGIDITNALGPVVSQNTIFNMKQTLSASNAAMDFGAGVNNAMITRNNITGIYSETTAGWGAFGINFSSETNVTNNTIANNTISDIRTVNYSTGSTSFNAFGIRLTGGTGTRVYYNSVSLDGTITIVSGTPTQPNSAALLVTSTVVTGLEVVNNILGNNQRFTTGTPKTYSIWVPTGYTGFAVINRNDYFGTTAAPTTYHVGRIGDTDHTTLASWRTATGQDANSISADPLYVSTTNLQPVVGSPVLAAGTPIVGITTDFTGAPRSATTPSIGAYEFGLNSWTGSSSTVWDIAGNWTAGIPMANHDVSIPDVANQPVLHTAATVSGLTIQTGASLDIAPTGQLTVNGTLANPAGNTGLVLQSTAAGTGSLNHSTAGVAATAQRHIPNNNTWRFLSSPVAAQLLQPGFVPAGTPLPTNFDFFMFGETKTDGLPWINIRRADNTLNPALGTTFTVGRGYLVRYSTAYPTDRTFAGALNQGTVSIPLTFTAAPGMRGWNLAGNPYPSSINWATVTRTMLEDNFYYIYDPTFGGGGGYVFHNGVTGIGNTSPFIAPHQGFFVKVTAGGTLGLTNANRAHSTQLWLKGDEELPCMLTLKLSHGSYWDEVRIAIGEGSDANRDRNDALKLFSFNPQMPQVYTRTDDQTLLALNTIPQLDENLIIPLSVVVPANGTMTLSLEELTGYFEGATVYLRDIKTNTIQNLKELPEYTFEGQTTDTDRFEIRFKAVGIAERNELPVRIWSDGQLLYVDLSQVQGSYGLQLTDLSGRLVLGQMLTGGSLQRVGVPVSTGVLIVRVAGNSGVVNRKVYIR